MKQPVKQGRGGSANRYIGIFFGLVAGFLIFRQSPQILLRQQQSFVTHPHHAAGAHRPADDAHRHNDVYVDASTGKRWVLRKSMQSLVFYPEAAGVLPISPSEFVYWSLEDPPRPSEQQQTSAPQTIETTTTSTGTTTRHSLSGGVESQPAAADFRPSLRDRTAEPAQKAALKQLVLKASPHDVISPVGEPDSHQRAVASAGGDDSVAVVAGSTSAKQTTLSDGNPQPAARRKLPAVSKKLKNVCSNKTKRCESCKNKHCAFVFSLSNPYGTTLDDPDPGDRTTFLDYAYAAIHRLSTLTGFDILVLTSEVAATNYPEAYELLQQLSPQIKIVAADTDFYDSLDIKQKRPKHVHTYLSLQIFNQKYFGSYDMMAFMDVDVFPLRSVDEVFCSTGKFAAVVRETAGSDWRKSGFNSGFYVYRSDPKDFDGLLATFHSHISQPSVTLGIQGVLNTYFRTEGFFCLSPAYNCLGISGPPLTSKAQSSKCSFSGEDEIFTLNKAIIHTKLSMLKYARWIPRVIELWADYLHPDARGRLPNGHPNAASDEAPVGPVTAVELSQYHMAQSCHDLSVPKKQFSGVKGGFFAKQIQERLLGSLHGALMKLQDTVPAAMQVVFGGSSNLLASLRHDPVFRQPGVSLVNLLPCHGGELGGVSDIGPERALLKGKASGGGGGRGQGGSHPLATVVKVRCSSGTDEPDLATLTEEIIQRSLVLLLDLDELEHGEALLTTAWGRLLKSKSSINVVAVVVIYNAAHRRALQGSGSPIATLQSSANWLSGLGFNPYLAGNVSLLPLGKHCWKPSYEICGALSRETSCESTLLAIKATDIDMIFQVKYNTYLRPS